jgi:hypothetical protein
LSYCEKCRDGDKMKGFRLCSKCYNKWMKYCFGRRIEAEKQGKRLDVYNEFEKWLMGGTKERIEFT